MKQTLMIFAFAMALVFTVNGQNQASMNALLSPSANDFSDAKNQGFEVFKILPRGMFDYEQNELSIRGGGAYYSFVKKSHSYNETPQIELQNNNLSVGFAGYDYGMIADLEETPLSEIDNKNKSVNFLYNYQAKKFSADARSENHKIRKGLEIDGLKFNQQLAAIVGHTYILRAIIYDEADTLVAFKVQSKDADGSLTIFWKLIKDFEKPILIRNSEKISNNKTSSPENIAAKIQNAMKEKGYTDVTVDESENIIVLRGTIPKENMIDALKIAMEIFTRPVKNELIGK